MAKKRKYDDNYILYGFTFMEDCDGTENPQCFLCGKVLANSSMKPAKLKEHLNTNHPRNVHDSLDVFQSKKAGFEKSGTLTQLGFVPTQKTFAGSILQGGLSDCILSKKASHYCRNTNKTLYTRNDGSSLWIRTEEKIKAVPMSNNVFQSRIADISNNILKQVMEELSASPFGFSMQLDESTDV